MRRMVRFGYTTGFANSLLENNECWKELFRQRPLKTFQLLTSVLMIKDQLHDELLREVKKLKG